MPDNRLGPAQWVNAGLKALAKSGFSALKADTLANRLGISRGSFYWHFADVSAFHAAILQRWREVALENIIEEVEGTADDRLEPFACRAFAGDTGIGTRRHEPGLQPTRGHEQRLKRWTWSGHVICGNCSIDAAFTSVAGPRARIMNWCYLGFALSSNKLDDAKFRNKSSGT